MTDPQSLGNGSGSSDIGTPGPDLTTPSGASPGSFAVPFARITVGVDFSPASLGALDLVRTRFPAARLHLVHVTDARVSTRADLGGGVTPTGPDPALLGALEEAEAERLSALALEGEETERLIGDPVRGILGAAERWGADLIVVGTHSQGAVEHFLVGSIAEKVVARSRVPVLTVRRQA